MKLRRTLVCLLMVAASLSTEAIAKENNGDKSHREVVGPELTGAQLYHKCLHGDKDADEAECRGYVEGFLDGLKMGGITRQTQWQYCRPASGVTFDRGRDVIENYLRDHPDEQDEEAAISAATALSRTFPCS